MWTDIRKKCNYAFKDLNRKTDQDELFEFMRENQHENLNQNISKVEKSLTHAESASEKMVGGQINEIKGKQEVEVHKPSSENEIALSDRSITSEDGTSSDDSYNIIDETNKSSKIQKEMKNLTINVNDPYKQTISQAFNELFHEKRQLGAMLHLCSKITQFKEEKKNNRKTSFNK